MPVPKELLEILVCPADHGELAEERAADGSERLACGRCRRRYPVRDGIPVMLIDEAETPS